MNKYKMLMFIEEHSEEEIKDMFLNNDEAADTFYLLSFEIYGNDGSYMQARRKYQEDFQHIVDCIAKVERAFA